MDQLRGVLNFITSLFRYHKLKLLAGLASAVLFLLFIFPYQDLSDWVTAQVSKATNNQVYLQFDDLNLGLLPSPALTLSQVTLDTPTMPTLKTKQLRVAPSILSLLAFRPGFSADAEGFLGGDLEFTLRSGEKIEGGDRIQNLDLEFSDGHLENVGDLISLPIQLSGRAHVNLEAAIDPGFSKQPDGDLEVIVKDLKIPASTVPTQFGPMALPPLKFSEIQVQSQIHDSKLTIEKIVLGKPQDPISGTIQGSFDLTLRSRGATVQPRFGPYELVIDLNVQKSAPKELNLFLSFLSEHKSPTLKGDRYAFKATGTSFNSPPQMCAAGTRGRCR